MRRYISVWVVVLLMAVVHVDWHFGRGHHHRLSLSWPYHWLMGLAAFFLLAWFCAWKWPEDPFRAALLNGFLGLFAGQIIEPLLEVIGYRVPMALVFTSERWRVFAQFAVAAAAGLLLGFAMVWARRRRRDPQPA